MNKLRRTVSSHAFLFPAGAAYTLPNPGGNAGRTAKPGATDPAWFDLGVSKWKRSNTSKIEDFDAPTPGIAMLHSRIATRKGMKWTGTIMEMSNVVWRMIMQAGAIPLTGAGGQYNPLGGDPVIEAWLQLHHLDQGNNVLSVEDYYVSLEVPGDVEFGTAALLDVQVEAHVLWSTLMVGTLS